MEKEMAPLATPKRAAAARVAKPSQPNVPPEPPKKPAASAKAPARVREEKASVPAPMKPARMPASIGAFDTHDTGFENVTARDLLIPRLTILQGLSPQVTRGQPEYDDEAKVGDVYDIGLGERFPDGVLFIPAHYLKQYLEWAPRESGQGLVAIHDSPDILAECEADAGRMILPNGNYVVETAQLYGLNVTAEYRRSFIPMSSTQLKKARRLLTLATSEKLDRADGSQFTPPLYYRAYSLTTVPETNKKGNWMGWKVERGPSLPELEPDAWQNILDDIKSFRESIVAGTVRGDVSSLGEDAVASGGDDDTM